jgi:hypothetical protein
MAIPGMVIPPLVMSRLEKTATLIKNPWLKAPLTVRPSLLSLDTLCSCVGLVNGLLSDF